MHSKTRYRLGRAVYMLVNVLVLNVGLARESMPLIAAGAVMFVGFFPMSRLLAARVGYAATDERTRRLTRRAASRAALLLFAVALAGYLLGAALDAAGGLSGIARTLYTQARIVVMWVAAALIASSLAHGIQDWLHRRRLEG